MFRRRPLKTTTRLAPIRLQSRLAGVTGKRKHQNEARYKYNKHLLRSYISKLRLDVRRPGAKNQSSTSIPVVRDCGSIAGLVHELHALRY